MKKLLSLILTASFLLTISPAMATSYREIQASKARAAALLKNYVPPKFEKVNQKKTASPRSVQQKNYDLYNITNEAMKTCAGKGLDTLNCVKTERDRLMAGGSSSASSLSSASSTSIASQRSSRSSASSL